MQRIKCFLLGLLIATAAFSVLAGCATTGKEGKPIAATEEATLKTPTKDILITSGDLNKPYDILGSVEAATKPKSAYARGDREAEIKELLKKVAYTKYGERVDAIINYQAGQQFTGGYWGAAAVGFGAKIFVVRAEGVAVSFKKVAATPAVPAPPSTPPVSAAPPVNKPVNKAEAVAPTPNIVYVYVKGASANLRSGPGISYEKIGSLVRGTKLLVLEEKDKWLRIRQDDGREGWIAEFLTSK